jgi:alkanesulfonate monooxygenase SsuD/methylene tetrahydromethanopterin reductase-like flavin-dependent oxidoreductase (luciferase family)
VRGTIPVILGGNSDRALERVASYGDGWYGFNVPLRELPGHLDALRVHCERRRRPAFALRIAVAPADAGPADLPSLEALGVSEVVLVEAPPPNADDAAAWVEELARRWDVSA